MRATFGVVTSRPSGVPCVPVTNLSVSIQPGYRSITRLRPERTGRVPRPRRMPRPPDALVNQLRVDQHGLRRKGPVALEQRQRLRTHLGLLVWMAATR
jgi:hypothetical protein